MRWLLISLKNDIYLNEFEKKTHTHTLCCSIQNEAFCGRPKRGGGEGGGRITKPSTMLPRDQALRPLVKVAWVMDHTKGEGGVGLEIVVVSKRYELERQTACELAKRRGSSEFGHEAKEECVVLEKTRVLEITVLHLVCSLVDLYSGPL